jgi:hypothetical protein
MTIFTRHQASQRAESCRNAADSYRQTVTDFRALLVEAETDEQRRIGESFVAIAESHVAHMMACAEAYESAGKRETLQSMQRTLEGVG